MHAVKETIHGPETMKSTDTLAVPVSLLEKMSEALDRFATLEEELEDYLLSQDEAFLRRMRQARRHHEQGETRSFESLKQELCIE